MISIRALLISDSEDDSLQLVKELQQGGFELFHERAHTLKTMETALDHSSWDIIFSEYSLLHFNVTEALELLRQRDPYVPFIIVSGYIGEEAAIAALKQGATDLILKDNFARLVPVVEQELKVAGERRKQSLLPAKSAAGDELYHLIAEHAPLGISLLRSDGTFEYLNPRFTQLFGYALADLPDKDIWQEKAFPDLAIRERAGTFWQTGQNAHPSAGIPAEQIITIRTQAGQDRTVLIRAVNLENGKILHTYDDFTAGKEMDLALQGAIDSLLPQQELAPEIPDEQPELHAAIDPAGNKSQEIEQLRQQRVESLRGMAVGIAHDFNNVLGPILMAAQHLQQKNTGDLDESLLAMMVTNAQRAADTIKQLLIYARDVQGERELLRPEMLIKEMAFLVREAFPKNIEVKVNCPNQLWKIKGDSAQLHQALLNLCTNARDAMPKGGRLTLAAENAGVDHILLRQHSGAQASPHVVFTVSDTGAGISPENVDRIFDPFFTTKPPGQGSGLGLSTTLGIVKSHGGIIQVASEPKKGAQFTILLPAVVSDALKGGHGGNLEKRQGKGELLLVVDDESSIRQILEASLTQNGYRVLTASDGTEALELYRQHASEIQVVFTDMLMPFMDGAATIHALKNLNPHVRIIATSGIFSHQNEIEALADSVHAFMSKPFETEKMLATLKEVLARE